jgi:aryl-alcohol dehydrogenase-like predicted oxidoreductase
MGTGGHAALGARDGTPEAEMVDFLKWAYDQGINYFDTSPGYGSGRSERILGAAVKEIGRDNAVVSTKIALAGSMPGDPIAFMKRSEIEPAVDESLERLQMDHVDVMLTAVADEPDCFPSVLEALMPELQRMKDKGKIRFIGSSEQTRSDGAHKWLQHALPTGMFDVAMVGHNMLNQSAQRTVFPLCREKNIGVLNIFTVRNLFWSMPRLKEVLADLEARGVIGRDAAGAESPLGWLIEDGECGSLVEAAYRYAAYTPGVTTVMCGTIDRGELEQDIAFMEKGPLPERTLRRLKETFGHIAEPIGN